MIKDIGGKRFLHDIRYRRDRYRQFIGIAFVVLVLVASGLGLHWYFRRTFKPIEEAP